MLVRNRGIATTVGAVIMIFVAAVSGIVPGTAFTLLTYLDMQGTSRSSAGSAAYSVYLKVTSVTLG
jgi:hypothetical protein